MHLIEILRWPFVGVETSKEARTKKLNRLVPFLLVKSNWREARPPTTPIYFQETCNQNFGIAILFGVVVRSGNYVFYNPHTLSRTEHNLHFTEKNGFGL